MSSGQKPRWPQFYPKMKVRNKGRRRPPRIFVYDEHFEPVWPPCIAGVDLRRGDVKFIIDGPELRLSGSMEEQ